MDIIDIGLYASYLLIVISTLAAIIIPLLQSLSDPKSLVKSGIGVGALIVIFFIGYAVASPESPGVTETSSKFIGASLITWYILSFVAILGIVYTEISKMIK